MATAATNTTPHHKTVFLSTTQRAQVSLLTLKKAAFPLCEPTSGLRHFTRSLNWETFLTNTERRHFVLCYKPADVMGKQKISGLAYTYVEPETSTEVSNRPSSASEN